MSVNTRVTVPLGNSAIRPPPLGAVLSGGSYSQQTPNIMPANRWFAWRVGDEEMLLDLPALELTRKSIHLHAELGDRRAWQDH